MPKRRARRGSGGGGGVFWLDRVLGAIEVVSSVVLIPLFVAAAILGPHLTTAIRAACAGGAVLGAAHLWAGSRLFGGRRAGLVGVAMLALILPLAILVGVGVGLLGKGWREGLAPSGWTLVVLAFCVARLGGWGPTPK